MTQSTLVIGERNWRRRRAVQVADIRFSFEVNRAGTLSCRVPVTDLVKAGWSGNLLGAWVRYNHPTAGAFGGVVTSATYGDGIADIGAQSFHILARKRLVKTSDAKDDAYSGTPGGLFRRFFRQADAIRESDSGKMLLRLGNVWLGGPTLELSFADEDFYETVIPALTDDLGYEWSVDADRNVRFERSIGANRTARVTLTEGLEIASARWSDDLWTIDNTIYAYGTSRVRRNGREATYRVSTVATNNRSIDRYGSLQAVRDYGGPYESAATIRLLAQAEVGDLIDPPAAVELTVVDVNDCWSQFREYDTIRIALPQSNIVADLKVINRAIDVPAGTMTVSGKGYRL